MKSSNLVCDLCETLLLQSEERTLLLSWLESDPLRGGAEELFRELGDAID